MHKTKIFYNIFIKIDIFILTSISYNVHLLYHQLAVLHHPLSCFNSNNDNTYPQLGHWQVGAPLRPKTKTRTETNTHQRERELKVWVQTTHRHFLSLTNFSLSSIFLLK